MNGNDYIKYITSQFVKIIDRSDKEGDFNDEKQIAQVKAYSNHWFGLFPFTFKFLKREKPD